MIRKIYRDLFDLAGTSGYEKDVQNYIRNFMEKHKTYTIEVDRLGSIFAVKKIEKSQCSRRYGCRSYG